MKRSYIAPWLLTLTRYNFRIIFAGKFRWFLLAAVIAFLFFLIRDVWMREPITEGRLYEILFIPALLLIFYPSVFGIQNDEDNRILEILFGIPNYRYKVWGVRLVMIYLAVFLILLLFAFTARILVFPIHPLGMVGELIFPLLFWGNLAFLFSTLTRSGNGTAVMMVICTIGLLFYNGSSHSYWSPFLNPYEVPREMVPVLWENMIVKNRIWLSVGSLIWALLGLLNLQKRERFV